LNGLFNGIGNQPVIPFVTKGIFSPNRGFQDHLKIILAGFTNITVGKMKIIPACYGLLYGMSAHITGKGFHDILLKLI
jgi:hypothetical protein